MSEKIFSFNIGVLGHVDSGKTSLSRCLSTTASTAAFDKNPQSKERGITLDLGFSSLQVPAPERLRSVASQVQVTLVDCPGHASLIRTIIAGAHIIDGMILVVDATKGVQTQTAECLVIGEILCSNLLVVLNKIDLLPPEKAKTSIDKMTKRLLLMLQSTKFGGNVKVVPVAAKPGGGDGGSAAFEPIGINDLIAALKDMLYMPERQSSESVVFAVDHCFGIRGQGTIMTGTVLKGSVAVNDTLEIPSLNITKKVKSMQMFRKPVDKAVQGDRVGVCVTQFDPKLLERGLACTPGHIKNAFAILVHAERIAYYKLPIQTKVKFHISIGNETVMAKASFFGSTSNCETKGSFDWSKEYSHQDELIDVSKINPDAQYKPKHQFALLQLEHCVPALPSALIIGSKLDMDVHTSMCRLAFKGTTLEILTNKDYVETQLQDLKVFKNKSKEGTVERMVNDQELIVKNLLKKDTNLQLFVGLKVSLSTGEEGEIDGHFGTSGKIKVRVGKSLTESTIARFQAQSSGKKKGKGGTKGPTATIQDLSLGDKQVEAVKVKLNFKKYVFASGKKMIQ